MKRRKPRTLWDDFRAALRGWVDDEDEGEKTQDPALLFHALFTAPLVIAMIALGRRAAGL